MKHRISLTPRQAPTILFLITLAAALSTPVACYAQRGRDSWQRVPDVLAALAVSEGSRVADVGAGDGYFTRHLADAVGATGRVFAVEISQRALSRLRRLAEETGRDNIEVVEGAVDDPKLPIASLDAVLVVNAYHEMTEHQEMLAGMLASLKPGGHLVILDRPANDASDSREQQVARHQLNIDLAEREVERAGFDVLQRDERFTASRDHPQWMLVARRRRE